MTRPSIFNVALIAAVAASVAACTQRDIPLSPLDDVCETAEYGKTVRIEGFLTAPGASMMCDGETCEMAISNRGVGGSTSLRIDIPLGSGRNSMTEPPDSYNNSDLVVRDSEGNPHPIGDWIVVEGRILNEMACLVSPVYRVYAGQPPAANAGSGAAAPGSPTAAPAGAAAPPVGGAAAGTAPAGTAPAGTAPAGTAPAGAPAVAPPSAPSAAPGAGGGVKPNPAAPAAPAKP